MINSEKRLDKILAKCTNNGSIYYTQVVTSFDIVQTKKKKFNFRMPAANEKGFIVQKDCHFSQG